MLAMKWRSTKIKLLSFFVLTFLCFNAGGAVCVAYCQGFTQSADQKNHCPLAKFGAHCPKSKNPTQNGPAYIEFNDNSMDCCVLSVTMIAAPVEKRQRAANLAPTLVAENPQLPGGSVPRITTAEKPFYITYSSPPADKRFTHIKNQVFRI
jgi:hypothetical protein